MARADDQATSDTSRAIGLSSNSVPETNGENAVTRL
jgi:hypothetical protein